MHQALRNQLQRTTQAARMLLERECAAQLEGTYDILPDGTIANKPGPHLDGGGRLVRQKLVEAVEHRIAGGQKAADAVADYSREAAFTCLNRFVALKMLEARELVQTCVSKGEQSGGFREFCGLAPGLSDLPDGGYQLYLESLCDELGVEVKVLFDRRDPASLVWPRRQALTDLLALLNDPELASAWIEDETIGWVYQYFNSQEERRQMREESQAPRNSRELAVRNQFFTPRYVVQFLTDNTLGRIWYEMRQGRTALVEKCQYLVRRPVEVFLKEGEQTPETPTHEDLSQEELLCQPVHVPYRPKKDPRDLKILDPACGSGHFLLYCFDLLQTIYEEAWNDESPPLPGKGRGEGDDLPSPVLGRGAGGEGIAGEGMLPLRAAYPTLDHLRAAVPGLILRHNLHGIDIDPRCAQIAAFALWMRAQRAYNELGLERDQRPAIRKTNIVVAEPMPGEEDMLEEFLRDLREDRLEGLIRRALEIPTDKRVRATKAMADSLCGLVRAVWEKMKLAGEAGSLLKIEEELSVAIAKGREEWDEKLPLFRMTEYDLEGQRREQYVKFVPGRVEDFWQKAETLVIAAIREFTGQAANGTAFRRRLFADDAERGFAFVDLCCQRYDVVLMNPPFGIGTPLLQDLVGQQYPLGKQDLAAVFVERCRGLAIQSGAIGMISTRGPFFLFSFSDWRNRYVLDRSALGILCDLGGDVLDTAVVETCATVFFDRQPGTSPLAIFHRLVEAKNKSLLLASLVHDITSGSPSTLNRVMSLGSFGSVPNSPLCYWAPPGIFRLHSGLPLFETTDRNVRCGLGTLDDFRFLRLKCETPVGTDLTWAPMALGGTYSPYFGTYPTVVKWWRNGAEVKCYVEDKVGSASRKVQAKGFYFRCGLRFPRRTHRFSPNLMPDGCIFSTGGQAAFVPPGTEFRYLSLLNSWIYNYLIRLRLAQRILIRNTKLVLSRIHLRRTRPWNWKPLASKRSKLWRAYHPTMS